MDDDLGGILQRQSQEQGIPFKEAVNRALRAGLARESAENSRPQVRTRPHAFGFKAGVDLDRLNQVVDELEAVAIRDRQNSGQA
ncbi:MAG: antitoxin [Chthoniobacterales bacterium]